MLQKLNERIQGIIAWIIVGLVAVTFALFGVDYYVKSQHDADVAATVNGAEISAAEFEAALHRQRQAGIGLSLTADRDLRQKVLQDLILKNVSLDAARRSGFNVSDNQAENAIASLDDFHEEGKFSPLRYQQLLAQSYYTPFSFLAEVRDGMILNQQKFAFAGTSFITTNELQRFAELLRQQRDYRYLIIPVDKFTDRVHLEPGEVEAWYMAHRDEFRLPERVSVDYVQVSMQDIRNKITVSDEEVKQYYTENHMENTPFVSVSDKIREQIIADRAQAQYSGLVEKLSDLAWQTPDSLEPAVTALGLTMKTTAPFTATDGNKGDISHNRMVREAAFSEEVLKLGNNSEPIQVNDDSMVIIRLHERYPEDIKDLQEVHAAIEKNLLAEKAAAAAAVAGRDILGVSADERTRLIAQYGLQWQTVNGASQSSLKADATINSMAFGVPVAGGITGKASGSGNFAIVEVQKIISGTMADLTAEQIMNYTQQLSANYGMMEYDLYIDTLLEEAKIVNKTGKR